MERKLGMNCDCIRTGNFSLLQSLEQMAQEGFGSFFMNMADPRVIAEARKAGDRLGLEFEFIHAPYKGINEFWKEGDGYRPLMDGILQTVAVAKENDVPIIIVHVSSGWHPPLPCDLGFGRFDQLVDYAGKEGIRLAFENTRKLGDLACLMHRYENVAHVGFCLDCGHENCYTETVSFIDLYHDRLWCTHLHDNPGRNHEDPEADTDYHFLPFDGTYDFAAMVAQMDKYGYAGSLMLEVFNTTHPSYREMTPGAFIQLAHQRAQKIAAL